MSPRPRPDFVQVRLSAHGRAFAENGPLRIHNAHMRYTFQGDSPVEVLRFAEWPVLRREVDADGQLLFELADEVPAVSAPAPEEEK